MKNNNRFSSWSMPSLGNGLSITDHMQFEKLRFKFLHQQIIQLNRNYSVILKDANALCPQWIPAFSYELASYKPQIHQVLIGLADTQVAHLKAVQAEVSRTFFPRQDHSAADMKTLNVQSIEEILRRSTDKYEDVVCILNDTCEAYDLDDKRIFTDLALICPVLKTLAEKLRISLVHILPADLHREDRLFDIEDVQRLRKETLPIIGVSHLLDNDANQELLRVLRGPNHQELAEQPQRMEYFAYHLIQYGQVVEQMKPRR
jgi:hypothetical protein